MSGTRGGIGRLAAMVLALLAVLFLLLAGTARAGQYAVVSCGWFAGADAGWADTTGGAKFQPDGWCVPPAGADPFDGVHLKSWTTAAGTVSGTRFARWRWQAPPGAGIVKVRATWWHALHDGFQQRLGVEPAGGGFEPFAIATATDTTPREVTASYASPASAFESRLLCAKPESSWCSLADQSWGSVRAVALTLEDNSFPAAGIGGQLLDPGWHRGSVPFDFWAGEAGGGAHHTETSIDGAIVNRTDWPCNVTWADGEVRGTTMQPCPPGPSSSAWVDTTHLSDGPHSIHSCVWDFAGNGACTPDHRIAVDNNPPAHPRPVAIAGGEGWHRVDDFDLSWANPDQSPASPIAGARYRVTGSNGYDSGVRAVEGLGVSAIADVKVPAAGTWNLHLWLRDEAGNESPGTGIDVPLRFDDQPPVVAFADGEDAGAPLSASVGDPLSGPAGGTIAMRRAESRDWSDLPTKLHEDGPGKATLSAPLPELAPGTWVFRAEAGDTAGNTASTTLRADGTRMSIQVKPAEDTGEDRGDGGGGDGAAEPAGRRTKTRIFARLRGGHGRGDALTVPFGAAALLSGRLTAADGAGLAGRRLKVVSRPSRGALIPRTVERVRTGRRGGFVLRLGQGTSRRVAVSFPGNGGFAPAHHRSLELRVRSGVTLTAAPGKLRTGESVRLGGQVRSRGAPIPRRGKLVAIQYLEAETGRWRPVLVTRTDHHGHFRARYLFRYISGAARIRLRATALAEERWPYAPGSSVPVTVEVHGG
ncbi:MAG TPA: hypothetical protein VMH33_14225 [Solirubrobacterales bacterium]|nr:hypothetical protein [Solirubrobacterales bacterium]